MSKRKAGQLVKNPDYTQNAEAVSQTAQKPFALCHSQVLLNLDWKLNRSGAHKQMFWGRDSAGGIQKRPQEENHLRRNYRR